MNIVIAVDKFKGCLTSHEAGRAVEAGALLAVPEATALIFPVADGGDGIVEALVSQLDGEYRKAVVHDPLYRKTTAKYGIIHRAAAPCAVIEAASASGLAMLGRGELAPMLATSCGIGEMIMDAARYGIRDFIIGLGGSATNDGGVGMLTALGYVFSDENGKEVPHGAVGTGKIKKISSEKVPAIIRDCNFTIACDVTNPLCGENGASHIFAPQKGASPDEVVAMDRALSDFAALTAEAVGKDYSETPGAGAAGGLGFAFMSYLGGKRTSGISAVLELIELEKYIKNADIVITGEGKIDAQTAMGKTPAGVAALAKKHGKPVIALAGTLTDDADACGSCGIDAVFSIIRKPCTLTEAMDKETARTNLTLTAAQVLKLIKAFNLKDMQ